MLSRHNQSCANPISSVLAAFDCCNNTIDQGQQLMMGLWSAIIPSDYGTPYPVADGYELIDPISNDHGCEGWRDVGTIIAAIHHSITRCFHRFIHIHRRMICTKTSWRYKGVVSLGAVIRGEFDTAKILANLHDQLALMNCVKYYILPYFEFRFLHKLSLNSYDICGLKFRIRRNLDKRQS